MNQVEIFSEQIQQILNQNETILEKIDFVLEQSQPEPDFSNSIFGKPVKISKELTEFLGLEDDEPVSHVDVTRAIIDYIKDLNLVKDGIITPDYKLKKLLGEPRFPLIKKKPELGIGYSYKNLQTYLAKHYIK